MISIVSILVSTIYMDEKRVSTEHDYVAYVTNANANTKDTSATFATVAYATGWDESDVTNEFW